MTTLRYAVVTPARNEEVNLERLGAAMAAQTHLPVVWIVVDDGSTDRTPEVLAGLVARHAGVRPRARAAAARAGLLGAVPLRDSVDVIVKVDADVSFGADYFAELVRRFAEDDRLAIASGTCYERDGGEWVRRTKAATTVWGATRAYRSDCLADLMALEPCMGWDGLDEVSVQLRGLRTQTFVDLPFRHHRPEGGRELTSLHQGEALGRAAWYMGYRPSYLALRALYRARREPAALGMLWGYLRCAARGAPQCSNPRLVAAVRERQRLGATVRRGAPAS